MRFAFICEHRHDWSIERLCQVLQVSTRGYRAWKVRPVRLRQRIDLKALAHIREHFALSNSTYGRPRMSKKLKEAGLDVGERRVGRLMKLNGIRPVRNRRHKVTTDSPRSDQSAGQKLPQEPSIRTRAYQLTVLRSHHLSRGVRQAFLRGLAFHRSSAQSVCCVSAKTPGRVAWKTLSSAGVAVPTRIQVSYPGASNVRTSTPCLARDSFTAREGLFVST